MKPSERIKEIFREKGNIEDEYYDFDDCILQYLDEQAEKDLCHLEHDEIEDIKKQVIKEFCEELKKDYHYTDNWIFEVAKDKFGVEI